MKKVILTSLTTLVAAVAFGQGTVFFANDPGTLTSPPDRLVRFAAGNTPGNVFGTNFAGVVGTNFQAQLYFGASSAPDGALVPVSTTPGRFRASTTTLAGVWASGGDRTLGTNPFGSTVKLQVRVWDINAGATYEAAILNTGNFASGTSASFLYNIPGGAGNPPTDFYMYNFSTFTIQAVPEPATFALAGLGAAALLIFRRRK